MENTAYPTGERILTVNLIAGSPAWFYPPVNVASYNQSLIDQLNESISTLKPVTGKYHGYLDWGYSLHLEELDAGGNVTFLGDASLNGGRFLEVKVGQRSSFYLTDNVFWEILSRIVGQPLLKLGHDVKI